MNDCEKKYFIDTLPQRRSVVEGLAGGSKRDAALLRLDIFEQFLRVLPRVKRD